MVAVLVVAAGVVAVLDARHLEPAVHVADRERHLDIGIIGPAVAELARLVDGVGVGAHAVEGQLAEGDGRAVLGGGDLGADLPAFAIEQDEGEPLALGDRAAVHGLLDGDGARTGLEEVVHDARGGRGVLTVDDGALLEGAVAVVLADRDRDLEGAGGGPAGTELRGLDDLVLVGLAGIGKPVRDVAEVGDRGAGRGRLAAGALGHRRAGGHGPQLEVEALAGGGRGAVHGLGDLDGGAALGLVPVVEPGHHRAVGLVAALAVVDTRDVQVAVLAELHREGHGEVVVVGPAVAQLARLVDGVGVGAGLGELELAEGDGRAVLGGRDLVGAGHLLAVGVEQGEGEPLAGLDGAAVDGLLDPDLALGGLGLVCVVE